MWVYLELKFYSSLPLLKFYNKVPRSKLVFFMVKIFSSFILLFSLIYKSSFYLMYLALFTKLSVFPILWVPVLAGNMKWVVFPTVLMIKKFPAFNIFLTFYCYSKILLIGLLSIFSSASVMLMFKSGDTGFFLGWSSMAQTVMLVFLLKNLPCFYFYFLFYSANTVMTFFFLLGNEGIPMKKVFIAFLFFFNSGFPPLLIFFMKILFLASISNSVLMVFFVGNFFLNFVGYLNFFFFLFLSNSCSNHVKLFLPLNYFEGFLLVLLGGLLCLVLVF